LGKARGKAIAILSDAQLDQALADDHDRGLLGSISGHYPAPVMDYLEAPEAAIHVTHGQQFAILFDQAILRPSYARTDCAGNPFLSFTGQIPGS
jgi:hypothetical protein